MNALLASTGWLFKCFFGPTTQYKWLSEWRERSGVCGLKKSAPLQNDEDHLSQSTMRVALIGLLMVYGNPAVSSFFFFVWTSSSFNNMILMSNKKKMNGSGWDTTAYLHSNYQLRMKLSAESIFDGFIYALQWVAAFVVRWRSRVDDYVG